MLRKFRETLKNKQRGAIMVFFAILVPLFLGAIGLAVDAGFLYMQKAKLQDVADATALAGAGHLKDDNREAQVESAVVAFAGANGYKDKDKAVSSNFQELADKADASSVTLEENAAWKIAYAIDTGMKDKDAKNGELRDHVRVVILKRVPTFFIRMLFPEQKEVVVKAVAAAEYVEGEEPVVSGGEPVIMAGVFDQYYYGAGNLALGKNFPFSVYGYACSPDPYKLPGKGTLYSSNLSGGAHWEWVKEKREVVFTPPLPEGREYIPSNNWSTYDTYWAKEEADKQIALGAEMKQKFDNTLAKYKSETLTKAAELKDYINAVGNKRYIGEDASGKVICNISEEDRYRTEGIDLYISGTYAEVLSTDSDWLAKGRSVLTDRQLKGVKIINNLLIDKYGMIGTSGVVYGNIYCINGSVMVGGNNNYFNGTIYSPDQIWAGGENNHFLSGSTSSDKVGLLCNNTLHLGMWNPISERIVPKYSHYDNESQKKVFIDSIQIDFVDTFRDESNNKDWKMSWGADSSGGGSSSGSSGSGAAKAHVRLVI